MEKARQLEKIKEKLLEDKNKRIAEERRTFYVAVTRARDYLYLFYEKGTMPSEFINDIDDNLRESYEILSRREEEEIKRLRKELREELNSNSKDETKIEEKVNTIVNNKQFQKYIKERLMVFEKENLYISYLPTEARKYFEQAMELLFIGEITKIEFCTEFAHNMQKSAEILLKTVAGENACAFTTNNKNQIHKICDLILEDAKICKTQIPSKKFIYDLFYAGNKMKNRMDTLKKAGLMHYIVRGNKINIPLSIFNTWKTRTIQGNSQEFLKSIIDLSNVRNILVHQNDDTWPTDAVTIVLKNMKCIIECCRR